MTLRNPGIERVPRAAANPPAALRLRFWAALSSRPSPATLYLGSKFGAQAAQNAMLAALVLTAGTSGKASIGLSAFFVAMLVPSILLGPIGGAIADRLGPGRGMTVGALLRALAITPAFFLMGTPHMVWIVAAAYSAASQVFTPSELAMVHDVQGRRPGRIYSALTVMQYGGQCAGILVIAPLLFFLGGQTFVFAGAIAIFGLVAASAAALTLAGAGASRAPARAHDAMGLRPVARFIFTDSRAFYSVIALTLAGIISRVLVISLPGYVRDEIGIGSLGLLFIVVPGLAGLVTGLLWTSSRLSLDRSTGMLRFSSMALLAGLCLLAFVDNGVTLVAQNSYLPPLQDFEAWMNTTAAVVIPAAFAGGFGLCVVVMSARFVLTELAPIGARGRVHAVQHSITESLLVGPVLFAGFATALAGTRLMLIVVTVLSVGTLAYLEWRRESQRLAESATGATVKLPAIDPSSGVSA